jgi:Putative Ig domain
MPMKTMKLFLGLILTIAAIVPSAHATSLDSLIATNGTVNVGNLAFSNFIPSPGTDPTTVDVSGFGSILSGGTPTGIFGLRFTALPPGTRFSQTTAGGGGGGGRELVVDISFTVTVTDSNFAIHSVSQSIDPSSVAVGNAILRSLTGIPAGAPTLTLFSCVQGTGVPSGSLCPTPVDTAVLSTNVSALTVDRQIQIVVGQKFGQAADGNASSGFFDVSFGEAQRGCPVISVSPATIPNGDRQTMFPGTTFSSTGGVGTVTLALSGTLPAGLQFDASTGTLTGTPQDHGIFTVTLIATDASGCHGSQTYTFLIRDARRRSARH